MTTSQTDSILYEPNDERPIPLGTLAYFQARNRHRLYAAVISEFEKSGLSQMELAKRLGKNTDVVCRFLGAPGNWTIDRVSDYLFAINGGELEYSVNHPLKQPPRNYNRPEFLNKNPSVIGGGTVHYIPFNREKSGTISGAGDGPQ